MPTTRSTRLLADTRAVRTRGGAHAGGRGGRRGRRRSLSDRSDHGRCASAGDSGARGDGAGGPLQPRTPRRSYRRAAVREHAAPTGRTRRSSEALELGIPATLGRCAGRASRRAGGRPAPIASRRRSKRSTSAPRSAWTPPPRPRWPRQSGARYAVTGSFADFYGKFRINARLVDAENGQILKVVSNDDPKLQDRAQLAAIIQLVSRKSCAAGLPPSGRRRRAVRAPCRPRR